MSRNQQGLIGRQAVSTESAEEPTFDPLDGYGGTPLISPAKRVGVAQLG